MELFKPAGEAVDLWGEGHGFLDGASGLTRTTHDPSTQEHLGHFVWQAIASTGEMWKSS